MAMVKVPNAALKYLIEGAADVVANVIKKLAEEQLCIPSQSDDVEICSSDQRIKLVLRVR